MVTVDSKRINIYSPYFEEKRLKRKPALLRKLHTMPVPDPRCRRTRDSALAGYLMRKGMRLVLASYYYNFKKRCASPPITLTVETTSICNLACIMCPRGYANRPQGHMKFSLFRKIVDESRLFAIDIWLCLFGEPLLHPQIFDMIKYAKRAGLNTVMSTNATLLDHNNRMKLLRSGLDTLVLSLDGATKETYESIRRGAKFEEVVDNIRSFLEIKRRLSVKRPRTMLLIVRMRANEKEIATIIQRFRNLPVDEILVEGLDTLAGHPLISGLKSNELRGPRIRRHCGALWHTLTVYWDGRTVPCCRDFDARCVTGDASREDLLDIWNDRRMQALRQAHISRGYQHIELCRECKDWPSETCTLRPDAGTIAAGVRGLASRLVAEFTGKPHAECSLWCHSSLLRRR